MPWLRGCAATQQHRRDGCAAFAAMRRFLASFWHLLAIAYLAGTSFVRWALRIPGGFELMARGAVITTLLLAFGGQLAQGIERLVGRALRSGGLDQLSKPCRRVNRYLTILHRFSVAPLRVRADQLVIMQIWGSPDQLGRDRAQGPGSARRSSMLALLRGTVPGVGLTSAAIDIISGRSTRPARRSNAAAARARCCRCCAPRSWSRSPSSCCCIPCR